MSFKDDFESLETAEDFLDFFEIECDPRAVRVNRLHILQRFHDLLETAGGVDGLDDQAAFDRGRAALDEACRSVLATKAPDRKIFRVHRLSEERAAAAFVPLGAVRGVTAR